MITKIKHSLVTGYYYVYRTASPTKRASVELRVRRTKAMVEFMKTAAFKNQGNFLIYYR